MIERYQDIFMSVRKNISLEKGQLRKLEPLIIKHNGNFSAAMREIIDVIDTLTKHPEAINNLIDGLKTDYNLTENVIFWLIKQAHGRLIDIEHLNSIIDPSKIVLLSDLEKYVDDMTNGASWQTNIKIEKYDDNVNPSKITVILSGNSMEKIEFLGSLISSFIVFHKRQEIISLKKMSNRIVIDFRKQMNANIAKQTLINFFGDMEDTFSEISKKQEFWKCIVNLYKQTNYNMVAIPKNYYHELLIGKDAPSYLTAPIEAIHKIPIKDIPPDVLIPTMKSIFEYMGIVERIDVNENTLYIYHGNTDKRAINAIEKILLNILNSNGSVYESRCLENLIVMNKKTETEEYKKSQA